MYKHDFAVDTSYNKYIKQQEAHHETNINSIQSTH